MATSLTDPNDIQKFNYNVDLLRAILWQYNEATNLQGILQQKQDWYDVNQAEFWADWYNNVFNLQTANEFGLQVWSIILDQSIFINNGPSPSNYPAWGFGSLRQNFTNGNFATNSGNSYPLQMENARIILQLRYFQLIGSGTVPEINRVLAYVFKNYGSAYVIDNHDMTQTIYFSFSIPNELLLALQTFDVLPRPAGVQSTIYQGAFTYWGFGSAHLNFTNGNFGA